MYCKSCGAEWPLPKVTKEKIRDAVKLLLDALEKNENIPINDSLINPLMLLDKVIICCAKPNIYWRITDAVVENGNIGEAGFSCKLEV